MNPYLIYSMLIISVIKGLRKKKDFNLPAFRGILEVKSSIPGRLRLNVHALKENPDECGSLAKTLSSIDSVKSVKAEPITGSLLIEYDQSDVDAATLMGAVIKLEELEEEIEALKTPLLNKKLSEGKDRLNNILFEGLGGLVNADSLVAVILLFVALRMTVKGQFRNPPHPLVVALWFFQSLSSLGGTGKI
ncbi:MAG: hypothetical protein PQJ50_05660 [Spirochaetales bacterium]|nr:hypothetical protein [Spirochaetales bacterium]